MFRFRKFFVYNDAKSLHKEIVLVVGKFPREYWYLSDQLKRSSLSIVLNIAEGSSKQSDKDFNRFIAISLGSVDESLACLEVACDLKLIVKDQLDFFEEKLLSLSRQLGGFSKFLKSKG